MNILSFIAKRSNYFLDILALLSFIFQRDCYIFIFLVVTQQNPGFLSVFFSFLTVGETQPGKKRARRAPAGASTTHTTAKIVTTAHLVCSS